jgi:hypothetical protein
LFLFLSFLSRNVFLWFFTPEILTPPSSFLFFYVRTQYFFSLPVIGVHCYHMTHLRISFLLRVIVVRFTYATFNEIKVGTTWSQYMTFSFKLKQSGFSHILVNYETALMSYNLCTGSYTYRHICIYTYMLFLRVDLYPSPTPLLLKKLLYSHK